MGCLMAGLPLALIGAWPATGAALLLLVVLGVGYGLVEVALLTLTQRLAAADVIGRVFGVQVMLFMVATATGALAAAGLVGLMGAEAAILATGLILPLAALALRGRLDDSAQSAPVPEEVFVLLRGLNVFAPLPIAAIENLALRTRAMSFDAGETIVEQGETGDQFYVIERGRVEVLVNGKPIREEGPGEYFGEIALLHDVPRTATVRALEPVVAQVLDRDEFLAAVGAHVRSAREVDAVAAERLATASP